MLFVGTSIIHPSTEGVFLLCNILDLLIYRCYYAYVKIFDPVTSESSALFDAQDAGTAVNRRHSSASGRFPLLPANQFQNPFAADLQEDFDFNYR